MRVCASLLAVVLFVSAAPARGDLAAIRKRGQLRVVSTGAASHLLSWKSNARPGLEREILDGFCRLHRLELAILPAANASALFPALREGDADLAGGGLDTSTSVDGVAFSSEVLASRAVAVTRRPARTVLTLDELRGLKVGTSRGTPMAAAAAEAGIPSAQIDDSFAPADLIPALTDGRIAACIVGVEQALPAQRRDPELLVGIHVGPKISFGFAVRAEDAQLRGALNEYIGNLRRSPAWNRLLLSYFGAAAPDILKASRTATVPID